MPLRIDLFLFIVLYFTIISIMMKYMAVLAAFLCSFSVSFAESPPPPSLHARAAVLMDVESGRVLYAKNAHQVYDLASLTKLVTLHLVYEAIDRGEVEMSSPMVISSRAHHANQPYRSSVMLLETGQRVTLKELMLGLAIASGNDAAVAVAENLSGSVEEFVVLMNNAAQKMNLKQTKFSDPAGIHDGNLSTALEFAQFARFYLHRHPEALVELHSVRSFTYARPHNWVLGGRNRSATWTNRSSFMNNYPDGDGLKTGYLDEVGYNMAATAVRGGQRLLALIIGVQAPGSQTGSRRRNEDAIALLDYGFDNYPLVDLLATPDVQAHIKRMRVWGGQSSSIQVALQPSRLYPLSIKEQEKVLASLVMPHHFMAPVTVGQKIGGVSISLAPLQGGDEPSQISLELIANNAVAAAPFWIWLNDKLTVLILSWLGL